MSRAFSGGHQPSTGDGPHGKPPNQGSGGMLPNDNFGTIRQPTKTLRDEFAMAALTGMLSANRLGHADKEAERAYAFADAMLAAREVKP